MVHMTFTLHLKVGSKQSSWLEHSNSHTDKNPSLLVQQYI